MHFKLPSLALLCAVAHNSVNAILTNCNVSQDVIPLGQSGLTAPPAGQQPIHIALGVGTQNYTCSSAGTFTSIGALATLFDVSCVPYFVSELPGLIQANTSPAAVFEDLEYAVGGYPFVLGHHYFIDNPVGTGLSPVFDFRADSEKGNPEAFVVTSKTEDVPSPVDPTVNVDWLQLTAIPGQGELASTVYRILTVNGQPPASCTPGSSPPIQVNYAANYWFFQ